MALARKGIKRGLKDAFPPAFEYPSTSWALKVRILSGSLADTVKGPCTGTVGVWSESRGGWVVPPMVLAMAIDGSTFCYPDILSFILGGDADPTKERFHLRIELTEKKLLRTHKIAQILMPLKDFQQTLAGDQERVTNGVGLQSLGLSDNAVNVTGTLTKPESKHNPENRGAIACQVELLTLTYGLDLKKFFKELPHNIQYWAVFLHTPDDTVRPPPAKDSADKSPGRSNIDRFRACAVRLQAQHQKWCFGEALLSEMEHVRKGSRAALRIQFSDYGAPMGQIVAISGNQSLTFRSQEVYEHRMRSFLSQFRTSSSAGAWNRAVEVLAQLNPSVMVDLDVDTTDFGRLTSLGTLFRNVGEQLSHGGRQGRISCLQELATQAPQALCSIALHVPFDVLVRELDGVIYDSMGSDGKPGRLDAAMQGSAPIDTMRPPVRDHSWHGDKMHVSPSSPRLAEQGASTGKRGGVMSALARAGNMLRVRRSDTEGDVGVGWETSTSLHATGPGSGDYNNMLQEDPTLFDRTWHGTKVSKEQMQTGAYEYSEVPRHGALRLPGSKPFGADGLQLVLRAGMLDALQLLSGVLGMEFLINFTMPCLRHKDSDQVQIARLIGQLHYSAMTAGCSDAASELRAMHLRMLSSGDELQQVNAIKSLPDFTRHDSAAVARHVEDASLLLVRILCEQGGKVEKSVRLHLLEAFVSVVPAFVRRLDEDIVLNEIGVSGGTALKHQVLHPKTLQGLDRHHISFTLHDAVCKLLEAANKARQAKWVADGGHSKAADPLALPPIPAPAEREDMSGLWGPSPSETKVKRTLEEKYVDAALSVVSMLHGERRGRKTPEQIKHISRSMGLWQVMIECKFVHRAMCAGLAALSMHLTAEVAPGIWEPAPAVGQDVVKRILEECTEKPKDLLPGQVVQIYEWGWEKLIEEMHIKLYCQLPIVLTAISPEWEGRSFWMDVMKAAYNAYLAERRVELAEGSWCISEDGVHIQIVGGKKPFKCTGPIVDPLSLAFQLPAALRLFHESGLVWAEALVLFKCMSEDDKTDVRWMLSHAIHCYPALFECDCAPVLCDTFERLLRDDDLDVAEGVHKHYMSFVQNLAQIDDYHGRLLASMFLDQGLWERRLHFALFQSDQLIDYMECGLVENAREEAVDAIILLLRHSCTTVRKNAARSVVRFMSVAEDKPLLEALIMMSHGTCREKQTFVWACEAALVEDLSIMMTYFQAPLEDLVERMQKPAHRSLIYESATKLLKRVSAGDQRPLSHSEESFLVDNETIGGLGGHSRIAANRLPQRGSGVADDPDFQVFL